MVCFVAEYDTRLFSLHDSNHASKQGMAKLATRPTRMSM